MPFRRALFLAPAVERGGCRSVGEMLFEAQVTLANSQMEHSGGEDFFQLLQGFLVLARLHLSDVQELPLKSR